MTWLTWKIAAYIIGGALVGGSLYVHYKQHIANLEQKATAEATEEQRKRDKVQYDREVEGLKAIVAEQQTALVELSKRRNTITERIIERQVAVEAKINEVDAKPRDERILDSIRLAEQLLARETERNSNRRPVDDSQQSPVNRGSPGKGP